MIVDDDPEILTLIGDMLIMKFPSIKITRALNGRAALATMARGGEAIPDMIITDMRMPVMNGAELCKIVRSSLGNRIKIVLLATMSEFSENFDKVFFKPLEINALFEYIKNNWSD
nr:response regulator [Candidatus Sigynarchaeota archaeon]